MLLGFFDSVNKPNKKKIIKNIDKDPAHKFINFIPKIKQI